MNSIALSPDEVARKAMQTPMQLRVTEAQKVMQKFPQVDCPLRHTFTPGLYVRTIFMPKDTFIISKIHKTEHPFVITKGIANVWIEGEGVKTLTAPHHGITKPGTRRMLRIIEDCEWTTFHPTNKTSPEEVEAEVIYNPDKNVPLDIPAEVLQELKG
jgi:hypothetical protein